MSRRLTSQSTRPQGTGLLAAASRPWLRRVISNVRQQIRGRIMANLSHDCGKNWATHAAKRQICTLVLSLSLLWIFPPLASDAAAEDALPPLLTDLSQLNLQVSGTEVVDRIDDAMSGHRSVTDKEQQNLVVVTLDGALKAPSTIALNANDFIAVKADQPFFQVLGRSRHR